MRLREVFLVKEAGGALLLPFNQVIIMSLEECIDELSRYEDPWDDRVLVTPEIKKFVATFKKETTDGGLTLAIPPQLAQQLANMCAKAISIPGFNPAGVKSFVSLLKLKGVTPQ